MSERTVYQNLLGLFFCHWLATFGVVLTSASAMVFLGLGFQAFTNPYYGLLIFLVVPTLFMIGLSLILSGFFSGPDSLVDTAQRSNHPGGTRGAWVASPALSWQRLSSTSP